jgi:quercetin dioxygenase-like cupin family protein
VTLKVRGDESGGRLTALETVAAPGEGPPLHVHAGEDESLYVLEGEVRFRLGDEEHLVPTGALVFIPQGLPHTWQNAGDRPARMLAHFTPAGMERFFEAFAAAPAPGPEAFARAGAPAGMTVLGPPLGAPGAPT